MDVGEERKDVSESGGTKKPPNKVKDATQEEAESASSPCKRKREEICSSSVEDTPGAVVCKLKDSSACTDTDSALVHSL